MSFVAAPRNSLLGTLCAVAGATCFSLNDMLVKFLSGGYALHQIVLIRAGVGLTLVLVAIMVVGGGLASLRTRRPGMHALRLVFLLIANTSFFAAIAAMPLAEATALFFVAPLVIAVLSFAVLGERVGPWRWAAVLIGLAGVGVMLRPGVEAVQPAALLALLAALGYASLGLVTRRMGGTEGAATMTFYTQAGLVAVSVLVGLAVGDGRFGAVEDPSLAFLLRGWVWPAPGDLLVFLVTGAASATGAFLIAQAYRVAEAGLVAPFEYVALPMAVVWGMVVFAEVPDGWGVLGMLLIGAGGLLLVWREARAARRARAAVTGRGG